MVLQNGSLANVDEVLNLVGITFKNQANLLWNSQLIGFNSSLTQDTKNLIYQATPVVTTGDISKVPIIPRQVIDEHNDSSVNTDIWTTSTTLTTSGGGGSVSETASYMRIYATKSSNSGSASATSICNGVSSTPIITGSYIISFAGLVESTGTGGGNGSVSINIYDGTTSVSIFSQSRTTVSGTTTISYQNRRLNVDKTGETANFTDDLDNLVATGIDLSSLNNAVPWYIQYHAYASQGGGDGGTGILDVYVTSKITSDGGSELVFDLADSETYSDAISVFSSSIGTGADITFELTADGTNYEEVTDATIHRFTNTGTDLKLKVTLIASSDTYPTISRLNHYAILYNTGAA